MGFAPYAWQKQLFEQFLLGQFPRHLTLPTGAGKTSLIPVWLLALAEQPALVPRRLVWVVNRRVVVDQATKEALLVRERIGAGAGPESRLDHLRERLAALCAGDSHEHPLAISTLRGQFADNREWSEDLSRPAIVIGTVDMIGSRLLFSGYGVSFKERPRHAGMLAQDALLVNDEAHLTPAFAALLQRVEELSGRGALRPFRTIRLSATQRGGTGDPSAGAVAGPLLDLGPDLENSQGHFAKLWHARKRVRLWPTDGKIDAEIVKLARASEALRTIVYVRSPETAISIARRIQEENKAEGRVCVLTGEMRGWERSRLFDDSGAEDGAKAVPLGPFLEKKPLTEGQLPVWLVSTSAGEVGANFSCDRLVTELDTADHLLQRFGRLNRFAEVEHAGEGGGEAFVVYPNAKALDRNKDQAERLAATLEYLKSLPEADGVNGGSGGFDISPGAVHVRPAPGNAVEETPLLAPLQGHLIEAWSQTTLHRNPERRPDVEPWLHGARDDEWPETEVIWRNEARQLIDANVSAEDIENYLENCPVRPHERLKMPSRRAAKILAEIAKNESGGNARAAAAVLVPPRGENQVFRLDRVDADNPGVLRYALVVLPPGLGGICDGHFAATGPEDATYDVSDGKGGGAFPEKRWRCVMDRIGENALGPSEREGREGIWRQVEEIRLRTEEESAEGNPEHLYIDKWIPAPARDGEKKKESGSAPYLLTTHTERVDYFAARLAERLHLPEELAGILRAAAQAHDSGKKHPLWQEFAGRKAGEEPVAKTLATGKTSGAQLRGFRHEFQSLADAEEHPEMHELAAHLVASHHGFARPFFPEKTYLMDREPLETSRQRNLESARRFARLTKQHGPWLLAWIEAVFHTADALGSAVPEEAPNV